ncbi:YbaK/EbsC family protein [Micromonospora sp. WMMD1082]|uniref:YbaK/EbsC family protein n=1 Tax=Micromonospora sp. WMMD1082 TaxID=3016104 RepID=UPI002416F5CC|nr:YbaK/EbsC family protein [Micromonospora sp. WMMD1082]MDG4794585.1 YbaK/EbsC family protein [Micromonospora sp. WMMD1082]
MGQDSPDQPGPPGVRAVSTYERLTALLAEHGVAYRLIPHEPQGVTSPASRLRGHPLSQAAKCIVTRVKVGKKVSRFLLAVVPGDRLVSFEAVREMYGGTYASFATRETAEGLSGCEIGTIVPFSFRDDLDLIVDPALLAEPEIFFNAARLDLSIALDTRDWRRLAAPRVAPIAGAALAEVNSPAVVRAMVARPR